MVHGCLGIARNHVISAQLLNPKLLVSIPCVLPFLIKQLIWLILNEPPLFCPKSPILRFWGQNCEIFPYTARIKSSYFYVSQAVYNAAMIDFYLVINNHFLLKVLVWVQGGIEPNKLIRPLSVHHIKSEPVFHTGLKLYSTIGFKPEFLIGFVPDTVGANDIVIIIMEDHCWIEGGGGKDIEDIIVEDTDTDITVIDIEPNVDINMLLGTDINMQPGADISGLPDTDMDM